MLIKRTRRNNSFNTEETKKLPLLASYNITSFLSHSITFNDPWISPWRDPWRDFLGLSVQDNSILWQIQLLNETKQLQNVIFLLCNRLRRAIKHYCGVNSTPAVSKQTHNYNFNKKQRNCNIFTYVVRLTSICWNLHLALIACSLQCLCKREGDLPR